MGREKKKFAGHVDLTRDMTCISRAIPSLARVESDRVNKRF